MIASLKWAGELARTLRPANGRFCDARHKTMERRPAARCALSMVTQITFRIAFGVSGFRTLLGGDSDEAILLFDRADGAQFIRLRRQFVFVRRRRTPDPHRRAAVL
jgi:hypothetical protein